MTELMKRKERLVKQQQEERQGKESKYNKQNEVKELKKSIKITHIPTDTRHSFVLLLFTIFSISPRKKLIRVFYSDFRKLIH